MLFSAFYDTLTQNPTVLSEMLMAIDFHQRRIKQIVLVLPAHGGDPDPMLARLRETWLPGRVLIRVREGEDLAAHATIVPLAKHKTAQGGKVTAYVCIDRTCDYPTTDPDTFAKQLTRHRWIGGSSIA